jgi:hypothetical protein
MGLVVVWAEESGRIFGIMVVARSGFGPFEVPDQLDF